jgi:hypothetical protein
LGRTKFASSALDKFKDQGDMWSSLMLTLGPCFQTLEFRRLKADEGKARSDSNGAKLLPFSKFLVQSFAPHQLSSPSFFAAIFTRFPKYLWQVVNYWGISVETLDSLVFFVGLLTLCILGITLNLEPDMKKSATLGCAAKPKLNKFNF